MKKALFVLIALFALAGCQKPESQQPSMDQRKDISQKLILKSLNDLKNRDLKSTIMDLQESIQVNPSDPDAYLLLAQILLKVQEYDHAADILDLAVTHEVVQKSGAWFSFENEKIGQGRESTRKYLKDNAKIMAKIKKQVIEKVKAKPKV